MSCVVMLFITLGASASSQQDKAYQSFFDQRYQERVETGDYEPINPEDYHWDEVQDGVIDRDIATVENEQSYDELSSSEKEEMIRQKRRQRFIENREKRRERRRERINQARD